MTVLRRTFLPQYGEIGLIHCKNIMKMLEIPFMHAPRPQGSGVIAAPGRRLLGSFIRRLTLMVIMSASRVDVKGLLEASIPDLLPEYSLRSRRPANISHANKQNACFKMLFHFHGSLKW